jgi:hypothetical protein
MHGKDEKCIQIFGQKNLRKKTLGRLRRRWLDDIRMTLREVGWEVVN